MTDKIDKLKNTSYVKLIGIIVVVSTTILGIGLFISSRYYSSQIDYLKSNIERLAPTSGESYGIDLSKYFVYRNDVLEESIPRECEFDDENLFYYSNNRFWTYEKMNPVEFIKFLNESKPVKTEKDFGDEISHVWYSDCEIELNHTSYKSILDKEKAKVFADSSSNGYLIIYNKKPQKLFQYIKLTRYNNEKSFIKIRDLSKNYLAIDSTSYRELGFKYLSSSFIDRIFNDLFSNLPNSIAFTELSNISMKNNWLFISSLSVFGNKNVEKGETRTVYCFNDWYVLYTELNTYFLEVQTPSFEPVRRGEQFVELNNWLSHFRVIVK